MDQAKAKWQDHSFITSVTSSYRGGSTPSTNMLDGCAKTHSTTETN